MQDELSRKRAAHFDALYRANPDPWNYLASAYEADKYRATIAALPQHQFRSCLEIGCSIGVLTEMLSTRADHVTGVDLSEEALSSARSRLSAVPRVQLHRLTIPAQWPQGRWDLVVLSEVAYYLSADEIASLSTRIAESTYPRAWCLLVNWTGETQTIWHGPDAARALIDGLSELRQISHLERIQHPQFVIDLVALS